MKPGGCRPTMIPIDEAAQELGTTALNVLMQIKRGRLAGEEIEGAWHVTAASLAGRARAEREPNAAVACQGHCGKGGCLSRS